MKFRATGLRLCLSTVTLSAVYACGPGDEPDDSELGSGGSDSSMTGGGTATGGEGTGEGGTGGGTQPGGFVLIEPRIALSNFGGCALEEGGTIHCWGGEGQPGEWSVPDAKAKSVSLSDLGSACASVAVGDGFECFEGPSASADPGVGLGPSTVEPFVSVRVDSFSIVAVHSNGQMHAWSFLDGEAPPTPPGEMREAFTFRAGNCGVRTSDGKAECVSAWSSIDYTCDARSDIFGQLNPPDVVLKQVGAGRVHACGVQEDDTLVCWGAGGPSDLEPCAELPFEFGQNAPPPGTFTYVASGYAHSCAVRTDTTVACWGAGTTYGECGEMLDCGQSVPPADAGFAQVAAGYTHSCGLKLDGTVVCWGSNSSGRSTPPPELQ